jgi:chromosome segregation ATPase
MINLNRYSENELQQCRDERNKLQESIDSRIQEVYDQSLSYKRKSENEIEKLSSTMYKQKEEIELLNTKREAYVNTRVEKELYKVKEQHEKDMKKLKDKLEKEHDKELEEKEEEIDQLEKQIKKLKKNVKKSKSDSDSD